MSVPQHAHLAISCLSTCQNAPRAFACTAAQFELDESYLAPLLAFARGCSEGVTRFTMDIPALVRSLANISRESSQRRSAKGRPLPARAMEELLGIALARHMLGSSLERELAGADEAILRHTMQHSMSHVGGRLNGSSRKRWGLSPRGVAGENSDMTGGGTRSGSIEIIMRSDLSEISKRPCCDFDVILHLAANLAMILVPLQAGRFR